MLIKLQKILKEYNNIENINEDSVIRTDFGLSSFDFINLVCLVEETFGVEIEEEAYLEIKTVGDLMAYIEGHKGQRFEIHGQ